MSQSKTFLENKDFPAAKSSFESVLRLVPDSYEGWLGLSKCLYSLNDYPASIKACERAEKFDPLQESFRRIQHAMQSNNFQEAESVAYEMLQIQPGHPRAIFTLSHLFQMQSAFEDQVSILQTGIEQAPANIHLRKILIVAQQDAGNIQGAIETASHLLEVESNFANAWTRIGLFIRYGFNEDALKACQIAYSLCDNNNYKSLQSELDLLRGHALKTIGKRPEAIAAYQNCISNKPESGSPWWALADMKTYEFSDAEILTLEELTRKKVLKLEQHCQALFALAKAYEMKFGLPRAMPTYNAANAAYPSSRFDPFHFTQAIENLIKSTDDKALCRQAKQSSKRARPIFIVGLPRSGSTLLEQILASHSQIEGTMELPVLPNIKRKMHLASLRNFSKPFLESLESFSQEDLQNFGQMYLDESAVFRSEDTTFFIDKLPNNFEHVGLIHKILPDAIILDIRRHPMDCGLSLFKQFFARGVEFSYKLEDIGTYYSGYLKLMSHWAEVLPDRVLHIQYENLVQNLELELRKIFNHIGLDIELTCLEFYKNKRAVRTASSEQVRTPIFTSGLGLWRNVKDDLAPLADIINKMPKV